MSKRPTRAECLMETAKVWGKRSTCPRSEACAVISRNGRVTSIGYIGAPAGLPHCKDVGCMIDKAMGGCYRGVHGELNAIAFAARKGISVEGCIMYTTLSPCLRCAQAIAASGISRVVYLKRYRDMRGIKYLESCGIEVVSLNEEIIIEGGD